MSPYRRGIIIIFYHRERILIFIIISYTFNYRETKVFDDSEYTFDCEVAQDALVATEMPEHLRHRRTMRRSTRVAALGVIGD